MSDRNEQLEQAVAGLNDRQREAVESTEGPLLVIAGPGTGKTQLLAVRAANIIAKGASPTELLCLTFSNAGVEAMRERLQRLLGRAGHDVEVSTFHAFAEGLRSRFPGAFRQAASDATVSDLQRKKIISRILVELPEGSPLGGVASDGTAIHRDNVGSFISAFKKLGLTTDQYREVLAGDLAFFDAVEADEPFMSLVNARAAGKEPKKSEQLQAFKDEAGRVCASAPEPLPGESGVCEPYARLLRDAVEEAGKLGDARNPFFEGNAGERRFKDRKVCERALAACDVFDAYQAELARLGLHDYDDMVRDAIAAIEGSPETAAALHDRYRYIQVDEFQDTNGAQMRLLELLVGDGPAPNVMAVCDDDQAVMAFQGASVACIRQFADLWHPKTVVLTDNYRSVGPIVELGKRVAEQIQGRLPASAADKDVQAVRTEPGPAAFVEVVCASQDAEMGAIVRDLQGALGADPDAELAVIAAKHKSVEALVPHLAAAGVPFTYERTSNALEADVTATLLAQLRYAAYLGTGRAKAAQALLPQIVAAPELGVGADVCLLTAKRARTEFQGDWEQAAAMSDDPRLSSLIGQLHSLGARASAIPARKAMVDLAGPLAQHWFETGDEWAAARFQSGVRALLRFAEGEGRTGEGCLTLASLVERLDDATRFGVSIDASLEFGAAGARVHLTTAHGAKGLEYDRVWVVDAEDRMWHKSASSMRFFPANVHTGSDRDKDKDDERRLLFVALTRAKDDVALYRGPGQTLPELDGLVDAVELTDTADDAAAAVAASWKGDYAVDPASFAALLAPELSPRHLSASALNALVEYERNDGQSTEYQTSTMLRLPRDPSPATDFGTAVHALLEDYVSLVRPGIVPLDEAVAMHRSEVLRMEAERPVVRSYAARYDRAVEAFLPFLDGVLERGGRFVTEAQLSAVTGSGAPLYGFCDLLDVDDGARTVRVLDYKTGNPPAGKTPTSAYGRQLQFYKLLVEGSAEFRGYTVTEAMDLYLEPDRETGELPEPRREVPDEGGLEHLERLIDAAWRRMSEGDFDVTGFEASQEKADALAKGSRKQKQNVQRAFEDWLINEEGRRA